MAAIVENLAQLAQYESGWTSMMINIWQEEIDSFQINRTGALRSSLQGLLHPGANTTIEHKFLLYGLFVARGTGRGYKHGNGGDLKFLDERYRAEHHLDEPRKVGPAWGGYMTSGKPRQRRDWWSRAYRRSVRKLNDIEGDFYGRAYLGLMSDILSEAFG